MAETEFKVWRGDASGGELKSYQVDVGPGYVVLDAIHQIQAEQANDLAVRWNCKAGKCGSCSAEINGSPRLMCMTRVDQLPTDQPITVEPMRTFPAVKDLVTDVSWNYAVKKSIQPFRPAKPDAADGTWRMDQYDVERPQEFRRVLGELGEVARRAQLAHQAGRVPGGPAGELLALEQHDVGDPNLREVVGDRAADDAAADDDRARSSREAHDAGMVSP